MRVSKCEIHNVLKAKDIQLDLAGHHLYLIGGKNDQGKTSALTAFTMAMCGRSGMDFPEVALKEGEKEGWVKVDLEPDDDQDGKPLHVEFLLKRSRSGAVVEQFKVTDDSGHETTQPRALLQRLFHLRGFDPLAFERMDRKEKKAYLQRLVGLDFAEQEKERQRLYKEREGVNRDGKSLRARFDQMKCHADVPETPVSVADLMAEMRNRQSHNAANERERMRAVEMKHTVQEAKRREQIARDAKQKLEEELAKAQDYLTRTVEAAKQQELLYDSQQATVAVLEDRPLEDIQRQIEQADEVNAKIRANAEREKANTELEALRTQSQALTDAMNDISTAQQKALTEAKWPVEGLAFDEDGVLLNGLPFEQASKSKRVVTSALIGMAGNPRLRMLVSQDGNDLDSDTLAALETVLKEKDFQMLLEVVTRGDDDEERCQLVIEEGAKKSRKKAS